MKTSRHRSSYAIGKRLGIRSYEIQGASQFINRIGDKSIGYISNVPVVTDVNGGIMECSDGYNLTSGHSTYSVEKGRWIRRLL